VCACVRVCHNNFQIKL